MTLFIVYSDRNDEWHSECYFTTYNGAYDAYKYLKVLYDCQYYIVQTEANWVTPNGKIVFEDFES